MELPSQVRREERTPFACVCRVFAVYECVRYCTILYYHPDTPCLHTSLSPPVSLSSPPGPQSFVGHIGEDGLKELVNFVLHYIADLDIPVKVRVYEYECTRVLECTAAIDYINIYTWTPRVYGRHRL